MRTTVCRSSRTAPWALGVLLIGAAASAPAQAQLFAANLSLGCSEGRCRGESCAPGAAESLRLTARSLVAACLGLGERDAEVARHSLVYDAKSGELLVVDATSCARACNVGLVQAQECAVSRSERLARSLVVEKRTERTCYSSFELALGAERRLAGSAHGTLDATTDAVAGGLTKLVGRFDLQGAVAGELLVCKGSAILGARFQPRDASCPN